MKAVKERKNKKKRLSIQHEIIAFLFFSFGALHLALCVLLLFFKDLTAIFASISLTYDDFSAIAIISFLLELSTKYLVEARRQISIDNNPPNLLRDISEAGVSGITIPRAIEISAERNYGPLTDELKKLIAQLKWKVPLSNALKNFGENCGTAFSKKLHY